VDRKALGAIVFGDEARRRELDAIVHPRVWDEIDRFFRDAERRGEPVAIVDAALMVETGSYRSYDRLIVVHCRAEQQLERLMRRDGFSKEEAERRLKAQMPIEDKRAFGDFLVDTNGTIEQTLARTDEIAGELERIAASS
jgi:dephospho-CoA kinase